MSKLQYLCVSHKSFLPLTLPHFLSFLLSPDRRITITLAAFRSVRRSTFCVNLIQETHRRHLRHNNFQNFSESITFSTSRKVASFNFHALHTQSTSISSSLLLPYSPSTILPPPLPSDTSTVHNSAADVTFYIHNTHPFEQRTTAAMISIMDHSKLAIFIFVLWFLTGPFETAARGFHYGFFVSAV